MTLEAFSFLEHSLRVDAADRDRIHAARLGDRQAFDGLVERHGPGVLRYLAALARSTPDAEDLAQETLVQAYRALGTFEEGTDFRAWLFRIAYHTWVHAQRRRKLPVEDADVTQAPAPPQAASDEALAQAIRAAVAALPEDQRAVVQLRFGEGLAHAQIAQALGAEVATVRSKLFRARQTLRRVLREKNR